ncbi:VOC family protein [Vibrio rumoiensis]|uniref:Glyoxalase n=1 Tax=Vibrio rumoiensis 1S-45 TaxID=1188252 RepID=A0A1E5E0N0_9VIBR|nr:VOC family protein [Vibrio rumoiensis]OEF24036.1 glyoxalase [Vibrio rumoiensis 1S-45]
MFSHIMLGANDLDASKKFYDAILGVLGYDAGVMLGERCIYKTPTGIFILTKPINGEVATHGNGSTFGFSIATPELVHAWHEAGIANGGITCEDPPGERNGLAGRLYLAYLRDPAGNKLCGTHRMA